ncbi:glutathione S-transferase family protein [Roseomonas sp. BN140053]|uniref:glutathione S-transferase family protein n=1 Tax=Roseomonas sp. BN140053 TaxID=3391898 RepID=UPI0039EA3116
MIRVHHLESSRSQRVLWLLEELGIPDYEVVRYERNPATMLAPPELRQVHPLGKSPLIQEDDGPALAETGAIIEDLLQRFDTAGRLVPLRGTPEHRRYLHWLHFAEGTAMTPLLLKLYLGRLGEAAGPILPRVEEQIRAHLDYMEASLADGGHFAGDAFSAADVQMSFPVEVSVARGGLGPDRPKLWNWLGRMQARPAYRRALERGGPYAFAR